MNKRKNYFKNIIAVLCCFLAAAAMTSCSGGNSSETSVTSSEVTTAKNTAEKKTSEEVISSDEKTEPEQKNKDTGKNDEIAELEQKYSGLTEDELKWEYDTASKTIVISGKGPMKTYQDEPEWYKYCDEAEKVVIGDEVTSVGDAAFMWFSEITEVKLGAAVEYIGYAAFSDCCSLRTVNFPSTLKYAGDSAFLNALLHSESGFVFPEGMIYIGDSAFYSAFKENTVSIPASLSVIGDCAFANTYVSAFNVDENNPAYTSVEGVFYDKDITTLINYPSNKQDTVFEIPDTVKTIKEDAIEVTNHLEKIVIPKSVSSIEEGSVFWNYALSYIDVDADNSSYKSEDGVLYSKDGKLLLCYPIASDRTEYTVLDGTERIGTYAMSQAVNITELHIGEGLKEIGELGLYLCPNLKSIGLPESIKNIDEQALKFCDSLTEIRYAGTSDEWKNVSIGEGNELLTDGSVQIFPAK